MKVSRQQAEKNRAHVVAVAAEQFRERGIDGIGIAELMKQAGLTHGGFYANFASKDALAAEALTLALDETTARLRLAVESTPAPMDTIVARYLSPEHRDDTAHGCALPALAADATRDHPGLGEAIERGIEAYLDLLTPLAKGDTAAEKRRHAMAMLALLVGALTLARAVQTPALSDALLSAGRDAAKSI